MTTQPIAKLLVANRGEIARRIFRTCRRMGIRTVAVFSDADRGAPFVAEADEAVPLGGNSPAESYLRGDAIVAAAQKTGCQAIHPGYGFLSENAKFAQMCGEAGLIFVGPSPEAIAAMGDKLEAKRRVTASGVPILETIDVEGQKPADIAVRCREIGWPVLVKATAGGGGRGMRVVRSAEELKQALELAAQEARSAFSDGRLFIERYLEAPRHVEVQVLGDRHGTLVHLFERECSIQRRHQKIIEEAPSPAVDEKLRAALGAAAVQAAASVGYEGAGTVEFLLAPDGRFFFLEMNTRLQVEHPVTECVTGLDLVRWQLLVAAGAPLGEEVRAARLAGHAIEARLYAEDPAAGFLPQNGQLHRFRFAEGDGVRVDAGVVDGSDVSPFYDPMLAKVIVHAATREEAARRLADALARAQIHGVRTNRELLVRVLRHQEFLAGGTDTGFLERHDPVELSAPLVDGQGARLHAAAAALAAQSNRRATSSVLSSISSGWRNNPSAPQTSHFAQREREIEVAYQFHRGALQLKVDGHQLAGCRVGCCTPELVELEAEGVQRTYSVQRVGETVYVDSSLGASELVVLPRFPEPKDEGVRGTLVAPLPGVVVEVKAAVGDSIAVGDVLLVIDSMKMLHPVVAPVAGQLRELRVAVKEQVQARTVLAVIDEDIAEA